MAFDDGVQRDLILHQRSKHPLRFVWHITAAFAQAFKHILVV